MKKQLRFAGWIYLGTWLAMFLLIMVVVLINGRSVKEGLSFFSEALANSSFWFGIHFFFLIFYIAALLIRYFYRTYKKRGLRIFTKRLTVQLLLPAALLLTTYKLLVYSNSNEGYSYTWDHLVENTTGTSKQHYQQDSLHRGMSVFGWRNHDTEDIDPLVQNNIEWVAVVPFMYQKDAQTQLINTREDYSVWSRRDSTFITTIENLHNRGIQVHLKPHLWMNSGWRSDIQLATPEAWDQWFDSYEKNMLHYARLAQHTGVGLFCVGTELRSSLQNQPERWEQLVENIRAIYKGQLTYAANWDGEFEHVTFWDQMDYIGIQAYFPLAKRKNPSLEEIQQGWDPHIPILSNLSDRYNKPILFTEVGYKSEASGAINPWEWGSFWSILFTQKSDRTQQWAYEALFQQLWDKPWFAGMYIWQWDHRSTEENAPTNLDFSPRFKPAQNTIARWYGLLAEKE